MWDGLAHDTQEEAERAADAYRAADFEVRMVAEETRFRLYTRRVATQVPPVQA